MEVEVILGGVVELLSVSDGSGGVEDAEVGVSEASERLDVPVPVGEKKSVSIISLMAIAFTKVS